MPPIPGGAEKSAPAPASDMPVDPAAAGEPSKTKDKAGNVQVEVIALRDGFYQQNRIPEGKRFVVSVEKLGSWMKCVDPVVQKQHERNMAVKKKSLREKQSRLIAGL